MAAGTLSHPRPKDAENRRRTLAEEAQKPPRGACCLEIDGGIDQLQNPRWVTVDVVQAAEEFDDIVGIELAHLPVALGVIPENIDVAVFQVDVNCDVFLAADTSQCEAFLGRIKDDAVTANALDAGDQ